LNKKIAIVGSVLVLLGCSSATTAEERVVSSAIFYESKAAPNSLNALLGKEDRVTLLEKAVKERIEKREAQKAKNRAIIENRVAISKRTKELSNYVGKTWYVFSGSTPGGWDCSGLVKWFYKGLGIELEHSATKQAKSGIRVKEPAIGDIVAFKHFSSKKYFHVGIYIGDGKIIHSREPGTVTAISEITDSWFDRSHVHFVRIVETQ
jgi:cell wall-associated NlpC family hydrolase